MQGVRQSFHFHWDATNIEREEKNADFGNRLSLPSPTRSQPLPYYLIYNMYTPIFSPTFVYNYIIYIVCIYILIMGDGLYLVINQEAVIMY